MSSPESGATTARSESTTATDEATTRAESPSSDTSTAELQDRLAALTAENERLRNEYTRAQRGRYRRTAVGLVAIGVGAVLGGLLFPDVRDVLFALGATGLFAAVLTRWLTPERFVSADVGERIYTALAGTHEAAVAELGLDGVPVYVPRDGKPRLYVAQSETGTLPADAALDDTFVVGDTTDPDGAASRGLAVTPTGAPLVAELQRTQSLPTDAEPLAATLADAVVEVFGLADTVAVEADPAAGQAVFEIEVPVYGDPTQFDYPIVSVLAVGLAVGLETTVRTDIAETDPLIVTCRWGTDEPEPDTS